MCHGSFRFDGRQHRSNTILVVRLNQWLEMPYVKKIKKKSVIIQNMTVIGLASATEQQAGSAPIMPMILISGSPELPTGELSPSCQGDFISP